MNQCWPSKKSEFGDMETIYDWATVAIFAGLVVLFLERSRAGDEGDPLYNYLIAAGGCALGNYLGNEEMHLAAVLVIVATLGFIFYVLKPLKGRAGE